MSCEDIRALEAFREGPVACAASGPEITALYRAVLFRRPLPTPRYRLLSVPVRHRPAPVGAGVAGVVSNAPGRELAARPG
ncbi:MAG: hypothetical protein ACREMG_01725 [Gemmatimonadales bacterium]